MRQDHHTMHQVCLHCCIIESLNADPCWGGGCCRSKKYVLCTCCTSLKEVTSVQLTDRNSLLEKATGLLSLNVTSLPLLVYPLPPFRRSHRTAPPSSTAESSRPRMTLGCPRATPTQGTGRGCGAGPHTHEEEGHCPEDVRQGGARVARHGEARHHRQGGEPHEHGGGVVLHLVQVCLVLHDAWGPGAGFDIRSGPSGPGGQPPAKPSIVVGLTGGLRIEVGDFASGSALFPCLRCGAVALIVL